MRPALLRALLSASLLGLAVPAMPQARDLTLEEAYALARTGSEAVRISQMALAKSRLAVAEAEGRLWPHIDLQASASYLVNPPPGYTVDAGSLGVLTLPPPLSTTYSIPPSNFSVGAAEHNYFSFSAALNQPVFTWGKIRNAINLASLQVDAASVDLASRQRDIEREVNRAYFGALLARGSREILLRIVDTAAEIVADRQKSLDQGTINRESVLEVGATLASLRLKLTETEQSESSARESLGMLTGLDPAAIAPATGFRSSLPSLDEQAILARALAGSTDMAGARSRADQARRKLAIEKGGAILHPDVNLGVSFEVTGQEDFPYSGAWTFSNNTWNLDLVLTLGIRMSAFDGMESLRRIQQAEKDVEMADTEAVRQAKMVRLMVRRGIENAVRADGEIEEKQARAGYLAEKLRNAQVSWNNGLASRDDLRSAGILSGSAELDLLLAQYTREEAVADLEQIIGGRL